MVFRFSFLKPNRCKDAMSGSIARISICAVTLFLSAGVASAQTPALDALLARANELMTQGKYPEAADVAEKALGSAEQTLGENDPRLVKSLRTLALIYKVQGRYAEARMRYERALGILEKTAGANGSELAEIRRGLEGVRQALRTKEETEGLTERAGAVANGGTLFDEPGRPRHRSIPRPEPTGGSQPSAVHASRSAAPPLPAPLLPTFPWPPPASSASYVFPKTAFARFPTVGEAASAILSALERSGYVERSFFQTEPGGVALVTRLERIGNDGTPVAGSERWPPGFKSDPSDLIGFLRGLFFAAPGYYRVIVFILQDLPFTQSSKEVSGEDAKVWLREGANVLPRQIADRPFGNGTCTALIYEFVSDGAAAKMVESSVTGKQHLEKAGLLTALEKKPD
jgi:hypothetical protein